VVPSPDAQSAAGGHQASEKFNEPACVVVPAGDFLMGCEQGRDEERPAHRVWVDAFEMAIYQVRNRDFAVFRQATGHPAPPNWGQAGFDDPEHPVASVSWFEAQKYCQWLQDNTGRQYRLPTEAEWERAASARRISGALGRERAGTAARGAGRRESLRNLRSL
jgi:formylglycine-generating enzyme required for sulfatase activity